MSEIDDRVRASCEKKHRYADDMTARIGAMYAIETHKNTDRLYTYKCPVCYGWHLTKINNGTPAIEFGEYVVEA